MSSLLSGRGGFLAAEARTSRRPMGRAAVHGSRSPATTTLLNKEVVEAAVEKGREQKQKAREEVEHKVDDEIAGGGNDGSGPAAEAPATASQRSD